jgi:hypothetical protein
VLSEDGVPSEPVIFGDDTMRLAGGLVAALGDDVVIAGDDDTGAPPGPTDAIVARVGRTTDFPGGCGLLWTAPFEPNAPELPITPATQTPISTDGTSAPTSFAFRDDPVAIETLCGP